MKFNFRSIILLFFVIGFIYSFINRDQFGVMSSMQVVAQTFYRYIYFILVSITTFGFFLISRLRFHPKFVFLSRILFFISLSWFYGFSLGIINGNSLIHIASNYLFLLISFLPLLAFSNPIRDVPALIVSTFSMTFYASFAYIFYSIRELPGFLSVAPSIFLLDFNRSAYGYSYVANSPFFIFAAVISLLYFIYRSAFVNLISPFIINLRQSSRILYFPWYVVSNFPIVLFAWFTWLGIFVYTSNAYLLWVFIVFILYLCSVFRLLLPLIITGFFVLSYSALAFISERFGSARFDQLNNMFNLIHFWGNGLGSFTAGRGGVPHGTELLSLGLFAQLGIFAVPFFALLLYYFYNSFLLVLRGRPVLFLLSASFSPYVVTIFSNPSIGSPWGYLLVVVGAYVSRYALLYDKDVLGLNRII